MAPVIKGLFQSIQLYLHGVCYNHNCLSVLKGPFTIHRNPRPSGGLFSVSSEREREEEQESLTI